jgi:hypothetical protein
MYEHSKKISGFHMPACFLFSLRAIGKQNSKHFASAVLKIDRLERFGNKNTKSFRQVSLSRDGFFRCLTKLGKSSDW